MPETVQILFACVHNAGRSQMAAGYARSLAGGAVRVRSGGSAPASRIHPAVLAAMAEDGIDLAGGAPQMLDGEEVLRSDVVVTMGCGDSCPVRPGARVEDWDVADPAGLGIEEVRVIRDDVRRRVELLLADLGHPAHGSVR